MQREQDDEEKGAGARDDRVVQQVKQEALDRPLQQDDHRQRQAAGDEDADDLPQQQNGIDHAFYLRCYCIMRGGQWAAVSGRWPTDY